MSIPASESVGRRYGRLVVQSVVGKIAKCKCDCGRTIDAIVYNLRSSNTKSCGCLVADSLSAVAMIHGKSGTVEWCAWMSAWQRCTDKNLRNWSRYGGRGIRVCDRWIAFENFIEDMGPRPPGFSLDRIDNDKDYCPDNCRWASRKDQARNRSDNRMVTAFGETKPVASWLEDGRCAPLGYNTLMRRIKTGILPELAIATPVNKLKRRAGID